MHPRHQPPSAADLASEANGLTAGLGIITMTLFPLALPGLVLALLLALPVVPLLLVAGAGYLLFRLLLVPLRLARTAARRRAARRTTDEERRPQAGLEERPRKRIEQRVAQS